jgi:hypothetical protein
LGLPVVGEPIVAVAVATVVGAAVEVVAALDWQPVVLGDKSLWEVVRRYLWLPDT